MKKFRLLVFIDDDKATNVYHRIIVESSKLCEEHRFFESPVEALEYFKQLATSESPVFPDAIFLDINMPVMDGWQFIEQYQQLDIQASPVVIMLTTSKFVKDIERGERIGIVHSLISKPLQVNHLQAFLDDIFNTAS
ncbi:MAG: response regulator [Bacteroidota bacterium]